MADNNSGDKTEKPTPKKIRDARKKGNVPKSRDLSSTLVLVLWLILYSFLLSYAGRRMAHLMDVVFASPGKDFTYQLSLISNEAIVTLLVLVAVFLIPIAMFGLLVEYLQVGTVLTFEKIKPKMENLSFTSGLKRMFGMDNLVEVIKHILKTSLLLVIGWMVYKNAIPELMQLPTSTPGSVGTAFWSVSFKLLVWTAGIFMLIAIGDVLYQRYSWTKKLRMSHRDIKQEFKESEGDPTIKQKRREAHQEWSQESASEAAGNANALIVNPTHIAIAISHDKELSPVPIVSAKGKDHVARAMREAAEDAHVPILRNVPLARELLKNCDEGDIVPRALFDIIAEVILWSESIRNEMLAENRQPDNESTKAKKKHSPPGEDMTRYPDTKIREPGGLS